MILQSIMAVRAEVAAEGQRGEGAANEEEDEEK